MGKVTFWNARDKFRRAKSGDVAGAAAPIELQ